MLMKHAGPILFFGATALSACSHASGGDTFLVLGLESDDFTGKVGSVHVVTTSWRPKQAAPTVATDDTLEAPTDGMKTTRFPGPWEKKVAAPSGGDTGQFDVKIDVYAGRDTNSPLLFSRIASTQFVPGETALLRVHLEEQCVVVTPPAVDAGTGPSPLGGPSCLSPQTCIEGRCQDDTVDPGQLEAYSPDWANTPDACKPPNGGPAEVQAGTGQADFAALVDGQTVQAAKALQGGGVYILLAVRQRNIAEVGSMTTISAVQPGTQKTIPAAMYPFSYAPDQNGYCKLVGVPFLLNGGGVAYSKFLGQPLDVTMTVTDGAGATATTTAHVSIAATLSN
jgi:hypothetical protein